MIYVDVTGRCGNQLFQYAFARKISIINNDEEFVLDFFHTNRIGKEKNDDSFKDELKNFCVKKYDSCICNGNNVTIHGSKKQRRIYKNYPLYRKIAFKLKRISILQKYQNKMQRNGIYKEDECSFKPQKNKNRDTFIRGYFENPIYFDDIKDILLNEFTPIIPRLEKNELLYKIIDNEESVCVSVRVWNEIKNDKNLLKQRDVCSKEYYQTAIKKMLEIHPNAHFIVFSNDINWVKKNLNFCGRVSYESGDDEVWEKLRLMYSCKHFIMSTSTFCWWAQYLSRNNNKTVISPKQWYVDDKKSYLILNDWVKIDI